jgi:hypothetical protein
MVSLASPAAAAPVRRSSSLHDIISPEMSLETFFSEVYERKWHVFRHERSILPEVGLEMVADWIENEPTIELEVLGAPLSDDGNNAGGFGQERQVSPGAPADRQRQAAAYFRAGNSFIFNSLQRQSPTLRRFARSLGADTGQAVDVYMYLTPPHSSAYGGHFDEMDAFMVQLEGEKHWEVCDGRHFSDAVDGRVDPRAASLLSTRPDCHNVTLRGGDVMYIPFSTPHKVRTGAALSAHLTVNVERQFHTTACFLKAMAYRAVHGAQFTVRDYTGAMENKPFANAPVGELISQHMSAVPALARVPAHEQLQRALDAADFSDTVMRQMRGVLNSTLGALLERLGSSEGGAGLRQRVDFGAQGSAPKGAAMGNVLRDMRARLNELLAFALDVDRAHRLASSHERQSQALAESLGASAALRALLRGSGAAGGSSRDQAPARLCRASGVRASLWGAGAARGTKLTVNQHTIPVPSWGKEAVRFCLCTQAQGTAKGLPFALRDVQATLPPAAPRGALVDLLGSLLRVGALEVHGGDVGGERELWLSLSSLRGSDGTGSATDGRSALHSAQQSKEPGEDEGDDNGREL